eukprot:scaffold25847_cov59-Phaeocystis_antarctica.AAC.3
MTGANLTHTQRRFKSRILPSLRLATFPKTKSVYLKLLSRSGHMSDVHSCRKQQTLCVKHSTHDSPTGRSLQNGTTRHTEAVTDRLAGHAATQSSGF